MTPTDTDANQLIRDAVLGPDLRRATFAGATRLGPSPWARVVVRPVEIRGERQVQFAFFDGKKTLTHNHPPADAGPPLEELLAAGFAGVHVSTAAEEIDVRTTKKGQSLVGRRPASAGPVADLTHNRAKDVPLPEGKADRLLEAMGILTSGGRVKPTMRAKFTQINEFLKHLRHGLDAAGLRDLGRPADILDCGCGASYLTLAAHHYLNDVLRIPARILGVDVNEEVVRKSVEKAERAGANGLAFACGKIGEADVSADVVVALHACDTATDDAIAQAVRSDARLLLCAPCCHHALNRELKADGPATPLRAVARHGILRERLADLVTDAFRAAALRVAGYRAEVVEFVSPEHTARNLLIRAVRGGPAGDPAAVAEYVGLKRFWGVTPYIEKALGEPFARLLADPGE
ncbi:MAG: SAM-dependent methyltransferase [Gemmataceae bacterium]